MKISLFIDSLGPGGAQRQLVGLAVLLKEKGYEVDLFYYHDYTFYAAYLQKAGIPFVQLKKAQSAWARIPVVASHIRHSRPDVLISYLEVPSIVAGIAHLFNRKFKLIVSERNTTQNIGKNEKIRFLLFRTADFVVTNSYAQERFIKEHFPRLTSKTAAIPNFVDLDFFTAVEHVRKEVPEILVAATIWESKNTLGFIDAVKVLKDKGLRFHISWYGKTEPTTPYIEACQKKIDSIGLNDEICLLEKTKNIRDKYQEADYFCLPSFYEGTPNVICEAMACGLPVMCSDVCDNGLYIKEGENGFLCNPKSADSMASALGNMLSMTENEYQEMRSANREKAEEEFAGERFVKHYMELIS